MPPIKAALIGTGRIAQEHLACLQQLPGVELSGVCDRYGAVAEMTADRFGVGAWFSDHRRMLEVLKPDVIHVTTPPASHVPLVLDALDAGCHVFVEKPIATSYGDFLLLKTRAEERQRFLIEDHNFTFNEPIQKILGLMKSGEFGQVQHVDVFYCASLLGAWSPFADRNVTHPAFALKGGPIADILPHLASLTYAFVGPHISVRTLWRRTEAAEHLPKDEFRALVEAQRGTATLGFSSHAQPNAIWVRVYGKKMQAEANLMEPRLNVDRIRPGNPGLLPFRNGIQESWDVGKGAVRGFWRRLAGRPLSNEGMWELIKRTYVALQTGAEPPVSMTQLDAVSRLVADLTKEELQF